MTRRRTVARIARALHDRNCRAFPDEPEHDHLICRFNSGETYEWAEAKLAYDIAHPFRSALRRLALREK